MGIFNLILSNIPNLSKQVFIKTLLKVLMVLKCTQIKIILNSNFIRMELIFNNKITNQVFNSSKLSTNNHLQLHKARFRTKITKITKVNQILM